MEEQQVLEGHEDRVWSVSWSPRGDMLASSSGDKTVRIWSPVTGPAGPSSTSTKWHCKAILDETHTKTVRSCEWAPSGTLLATASFDNTACVWEYSGGEFECLATLEGHESELKSVAWNGDSTLLATCSRDKSVWVWEIPSAHGGGVTDFDCVAVLHGHTQDVKMVRWHPHENLLVSASYDDTIKVWAEDPDSNDWACVQTLGGQGSGGHSSTVWSISFNADGTSMVSSSDDLTLKVWDTSADPRELSSAGGASSTNGGASSSHSSPGWRHLCTVSGHHKRSIFSVDWSIPGNRIASASGDDCIRIFQPSAMLQDRDANGASSMSEALPSMLELDYTKQKAHSTDVNCVRWHPKDPSLLASAGDDEVVKLWRMKL